MPRGALAQYLRGLLGQKENFTVYFSGKGDHYYIQTRHNDLHFPLQLFLGELKEKLDRKTRVNNDRVNRIGSCLLHIP